MSHTQEPSLPHDARAIRGLLDRTIQVLQTRISRTDLQQVAEAFSCLCWHFPDYDVKVFMLLSEIGALQCAHEHDGIPQVTVTLEAKVFHDACLGKTSFGREFLMGRLPFQESYQHRRGRWVAPDGSPPADTSRLTSPAIGCAEATHLPLSKQKA